MDKLMVKKISYLEPLPKELAQKYVYLIGTGHSIMCVLKQQFWTHARNRCRKRGVYMGSAI